jgi:hypothetical protein
MLTQKHVLRVANFMAQTEWHGEASITEVERFALELIESAKRMPKSVRDEITRAQKPR